MAVKTKRYFKLKKSFSCTMPGIYRAVAFIDGVVTIFHGPKPCAHVARTMELGGYYRSLVRNDAGEPFRATPLISTNLNEKHSIFGGSSELEKCIDYVVKSYKPKCIVIAGSCVAGVIGDDIESIGKEKEAFWQVPILTFPYSGFLNGEYYDGYASCAKKLIDRFAARKQPKDPHGVVLLGDQGGPGRIYAAEVERLLKYFSLHVMGQFPSFMVLEEIAKLPSASLNVVLSNPGTPNKGLRLIAAALENKFSVPAFGLQEHPCGWKKTEEWLYNLGELLDKEDEAQKAIKSEKKYLQDNLAEYNTDLNGVKTVICIGRLLEYFSPDRVFDILNQSTLKITGVILLDCLESAEAEKMRKRIEFLTDVPIMSQQDGEELLLAADVVVTTHELEYRDLRQMFIPMLPVVGVKGVLSLLESIRILYYRHGHKGGLVYA